MIEIIPAILTNDISEVGDKIGLCEAVVQRVQIDIIDGIFVNNKTIDPNALESIETDLLLDFHLMVKEPIHWVERTVRGGADRVIAQIEEMDDQLAFIGKANETGLRVGLALDLETPISKIEEEAVGSLDVILLMAVKAGWGGQKFDMRVLDKIKELREIKVKNNLSFEICVDGGETEDVIDDTYFAGADEVVIGKRLFEGDLSKNISVFQKAVNG